MPLNPPQAYRKTAYTHRRGTAAARPAAADVLPGTLYFATDTFVITRSTGVVWESYSNAVVPTFTTGSVIFAGAAGELAQDNANLFWDDTNNRLGIGTAAPGAPLEILVTGITTGLTSDAARLNNSTASTLAVPLQWSPNLNFKGTAWDTDDSVSRTIQRRIQFRTRSGTSQTGGLYISHDDGNGVFSDEFVIGNITVGDNPRFAIRDGNLLFRNAGRGISFVSAPLTAAVDTNFLFSGDVSGGLNRMKVVANPGYLFIEGNNSSVAAGTPNIDIRGFDTANNTPITYTRRRSVTNGAVGNGFGGRELWQASSSTTNDQDQGALDVIWTDKTHASRTAKLSVLLVNNAAALAEKLALHGRGLLDVTAGYITWIGQKRTSAQFDKTNDAALANITGLSVNVEAGKVYYFEAQLFVDADVTGGHQYAIAGSATATSIIYQIEATDNTLLVFVITARKVALAGAAGQAGSTVVHTIIKGQIVVNAAGTLTVQFAQNAATPATTSSVLVGSTFIVQEMA